MQTSSARLKPGCLLGILRIARFRVFAGATLLAASVIWLPRPVSGQEILGLMTGGVNGTYVQIGQDIANVFEGSGLRVIPMLGKGSQQNIIDLLYVNGVDLAIVQSDVLQIMSRQEGFTDITERIGYISRLYEEEIHLVGHDRIRSTKDLDGRRVAIGTPGSGSEMTALNVFGALDIAIEPVGLGGDSAISALVRGDVDAVFMVVGQPSSLVRSVPETGFRFIDISDPKLPETYLEAAFTSDTYPNLLGPDETAPTIAVSAILAAYRWTQGSRRAEAVAEFSSVLLQLRPVLMTADFHPKWAEFDPMQEAPTWVRVAGAQ